MSSYSQLHSDRRIDLDALRGLAVALVLGYHAFPAVLPGGFVGVDIFFVISGYLITSLICQDLRENTFSIVQFYQKRVRRLMPALLLVVVATMFVGWFNLTEREYMGLAREGAFGLGFLSNFHTYFDSGYFATYSMYRPFLHLWSLAVEEQFYLLWPLVLIFAVRVRLSLKLVIPSLCAASFVCSIIQTTPGSQFGYLMPHTRAWELLAGAVLSIFPFALSHGIRRWVVLAASFTLIGVGLMMVDASSTFPGWIAVLPVLGTCGFIAAGEGGFGIAEPVVRGLAMIGVVSYPLYLWHWPILSMSRLANGGELSAFTRTILLLVSLVLAVLTFVLVEKPIRRPRLAASSRVVVAVLIVAFVGCTAVVKVNGVAGRIPTRAIGTERFSEIFTPQGPGGDTSKCQARYPGGFWFCQEKGDGDNKIVVIGDSVANSLFFGFANEIGETPVAMIANPLCPPLLDVKTINWSGQETCHGALREVIQSLAADLSVRTIVIAASWSEYVNGSVFNDTSVLINLTDTAIKDGDIVDIKSKIIEVLEALTAAGKRVVLMGPLPHFFGQPQSCAAKRPFFAWIGETNCTINWENAWDFVSQASEITSSAAAAVKGVSYLDPWDVVCPARHCMVSDGVEPMWMDGTHPTVHSASMLARAILSKIRN